MASRVDVANFAIQRLGISETIQDLSEQTTKARIASRWIDQCRDEVLRDFQWGFASRAQALAQVSDQTYPGWGYVYQYPDDAIRIWSIGDAYGVRGWISNPYTYRSEEFYPSQLYRPAWQVALKDDGVSRVIVTDVYTAWAYVTVRVTNTGLMPQDFISAWAWKLAAELAAPLKVDAALVQQALRGYESYRLRAAANSMNEAREDRDTESVSISGRY